jgi:hypothetical protein|tara:strand:+ start:1330 stop:1590 length:261 start_codon:yes stop_codon:yes gene_type:complete
MSNQKKEYDNPQDAAKDLLTIGGAAILNKATSGVQKKVKKKAGEWMEVTPGVSQVFKKAKDLKKKGWSGSISPDEGGIKFTIKKTF